jgi:hypothetical protein
MSTSTSTPKWTRGPWGIQAKPGDGICWIVKNEGTDSENVAVPEHIGWADGRANANLIAAAPDMFNAVDAALIYLQRGDLTNLGQLADLMETLRAAQNLAVWGRASSPARHRTTAGNDSPEISPALGSWRFSGDGDAEIALVSPCAATERFTDPPLPPAGWRPPLDLNNGGEEGAR